MTGDLMTWFAVGAVIIWAVLLCVVTVVQVLYMESLRLRSRYLPVLSGLSLSMASMRLARSYQEIFTGGEPVCPHS